MGATARLLPLLVLLALSSPSCHGRWRVGTGSDTASASVRWLSADIAGSQNLPEGSHAVHAASVERLRSGAEGQGEGAEGYTQAPSCPECRTLQSALRRELQGTGGVNQTYWGEVQALMAFKAANIDPTGLLRSWRLPSVKYAQRNPHFVCTWRGINCTKTGNVNAIQLENPTFNRCLWGNQTVGQSIPSQFATFSELRRLVLGGLGWCGPQVPAGVPPASPVTPFGGLIGTIPASLSALEKLVLLDLSKNQLRGDVPTELGALTGLKVIKLDNNLFTGSFLAFVQVPGATAPAPAPAPEPAKPSANGTVGNGTAGSGTVVPNLGAALGRFTRLQNLSLSNNNFTGNIPSGLSKVKTLRSLQMSFLPVTGQLPGDLGQNLRSLEVASNPMVNGSLPGSWGNLTKLQSLVLQNMTVTGNLTKLLANMKSLRSLQLMNVSLSGSLPQSLGSKNFTLLEASMLPNLTGSIPSALVRQLCTNTTISTLILTSNDLSGPFPTGLANCTKLKTINLSNNFLSGPFPAPSLFAALQKLATFSVARNDLSGGVGPATLTSAPALQSFDVSRNELSGAPPAVDCAANVNLTSVSLAGNTFEGQLADLLPTSCAKKLTAVDYSGNKLSGSMPETLAEYTNLKDLSLEKLGMEGKMVLPKNSSNLRALRLAGNAFAGTIPSQLFRASPALQTVDLSGSPFVGEIPFPVDGYKGTPMLREIRMANCNLSGNISATFAQLRLLRVLDLANNKFSGAIPVPLTNTTQLQQLNLSGNALTGSLPPQLGNWTFLLSMNLSRNQLSGAIPRPISPPGLKRMTSLDLSSNKLNGSIPSGFGNAPDTSFVDLSSNEFTGQVPLNSTGQPALPPAAVANNSQLCGGSGYPACPSSALSTGGLVGLILMGCVIGLAFCILLFFMLREPNRWAGGKMLVYQESEEGEEEHGAGFTVNDLVASSHQFSKDNKIVGGGLSPCYSAELPDGTPAAVTRLTEESALKDVDPKEFERTAGALGELAHPNVVPLLGAFMGAKPRFERLLVHEFCGENLEAALQGGGGKLGSGLELQRWEVRKGIALDVARGLRYLHHDCVPPVAHRDVKPANVVVNFEDGFVARLAQTGVARDADVQKMAKVEHIKSEIRAPGEDGEGDEVEVFEEVPLGSSEGYVGPEFAVHERLGVKGDVYAFGVTLLRLLTGRRPTDEGVQGVGLARWVGSHAAAAVVDPNMEVSEEEKDQVLGAIWLGLLCISPVPVDRPSMDEVVALLEHLDNPRRS